MTTLAVADSPRTSPAPLTTADKPPAYRLLPFMVCLLAVGIRIYQYAWNKSLYVDEAALAENITGRSFAELTGTLAHNQVAPLGFLYLERLAVLLFGQSEYALRLVPLLAAIASVPLFWAVASRTLRPTAAVFALAMFALSPRLIYYAAEVKQYSMDIALALAMVLLGLWLWRKPSSASRFITAAVVGSLAVWFSQPVIFYLASMGLFLLAHALTDRDRRQLVRLSVVGSMWVSSFTLALLVSRRSLADAAFMEGWWSDGFLPVPLALADLSEWSRVLVRLAREPLEFMVPAVAVAGFVAGTISLAKRRPLLLIPLTGPLALAIAGSLLGIYPLGGSVPYSGRVVLYLAPVLLLVVAEGADAARRLMRIRPSVFAAAVGIAMVVPRLEPMSLVPIYRQVPSAQSFLWIPARLPVLIYPEYRPVLEHLAEARAAGELVYVYRGALLNFRYYAPRLGFERDEWIAGRTTGASREEVMDDLSSLQGRGRVWIFLTNTWNGEEDHFVSTLGRPLRAMGGPGVFALLYDFGP